MIRLPDHVEVVLDHEHRVAGIHEPLEHLEQLRVGEEPGRRPRRGCRASGRWRPSSSAASLTRRLAPRERRRRLAEADVVEPDDGASAAAGGSSGSSRRTRAPPRRTSRARRLIEHRLEPASSVLRLATPVTRLAGDVHVGRKCISILICPLPLHVLQRPRGRWGRSGRACSRAPWPRGQRVGRLAGVREQVGVRGGFDLGVRPIGVWSISITLSSVDALDGLVGAQSRASCSGLPSAL